MTVDMEGFEACMAEQRERSRAAGKAGTGPSLKFEAEATAHLQRIGVPVTDDSPKCVACYPLELPSLCAKQLLRCWLGLDFMLGVTLAALALAGS